MVVVGRTALDHVDTVLGAYRWCTQLDSTFWDHFYYCLTSRDRSLVMSTRIWNSTSGIYHDGQAKAFYRSGSGIYLSWPRSQMWIPLSKCISFTIILTHAKAQWLNNLTHLCIFAYMSQLHKSWDPDNIIITENPVNVYNVWELSPLLISMAYTENPMAQKVISDDDLWVIIFIVLWWRT